MVLFKQGKLKIPINIIDFLLQWPYIILSLMFTEKWYTYFISKNEYKPIDIEFGIN